MCHRMKLSKQIREESLEEPATAGSVLLPLCPPSPPPHRCAPQRSGRRARWEVCAQHPPAFWTRGRVAGAKVPFKGCWPEALGRQMSPTGKSLRDHFSLLQGSESSEREGSPMGSYPPAVVAEAGAKDHDLDTRVPLKSFGHQYSRGTYQPLTKGRYGHHHSSACQLRLSSP